jgi:DNA-binding transcriptional MocR family regulator
MKIPTGSAYNKVTLLILADHYNQETQLCCPSVRRVAKMGDMSESTVKRSLKQLEKDGLIEIVHRVRDDGGMMSNQYQLTPRFGYPENYIRDEFDIVNWNPSPENPPPVHREPSTRPDGPTNNLEYNLEKKPIGQNAPDGLFDQFWKVYPKKVKKVSARKAWNKHKLDSLVDALVADVKNRKANCRQWKDGYIPDPTTYINGERWEDEIQQITEQQAVMKLPKDLNKLMAFGTKMGFPARTGEDEQPYRVRLMGIMSRQGTAQ